MAVAFGPLMSGVLWLLDQARGLHQHRRRVRVLVHRAFFVGDVVPFLFVNVVNLSSDRDVELTHVWFEVEPTVHVVLAERSLPVRLRPDQSWETWVEWGKLAGVSHPETRARVRLSTGKVIKSRLNPSVPPVGFVPGGSDLPPTRG